MLKSVPENLLHSALFPRKAEPNPIRPRIHRRLGMAIRRKKSSRQIQFFIRAFTGSFTFGIFSNSTLRSWPATFSTRRM